MQRKLTILSGLVFSGAIALNGNLVWSQTGARGVVRVWGKGKWRIILRAESGQRRIC